MRTRSTILLLTFALLSCRGASTKDGDLLVPGLLERSVVEGGPNPAALTFDVTNMGNCQLAYSLTTATASGGAWLSVSPTNGMVAAGGSQTVNVAIDVVATNLLPGNYVGTVTAAGTCTSTGQAARGSPVDIAVNLRVTPRGATLAVSTTSIGVDTDPLLNQWSPVAANPYCGARTGATGVWTGRELWVFGGDAATALCGKYDPLTAQWNPMASAGAPSARSGHTATWSGSEMLVWGGLDVGSAMPVATGARLGLSWTAMGTVNAPSARSAHSAVWTGVELLVWGGQTASGPTNTGARYSPATNTWVAMPGTGAPSDRRSHVAVWTGREMLIWGGVGTSPDTGAAYNPPLGTWRALAAAPTSAAADARAVWTGAFMLVHTTTGLYAYSPSKDEWTTLPSPTNTFAAASTQHAWSGLEWIVHGAGFGERYNPVTQAWTPMSSMNGPGTRTQAVGAWVGLGFVVFGGGSSNTGALYR